MRKCMKNAKIPGKDLKKIDKSLDVLYRESLGHKETVEKMLSEAG